MSQQELFDFNDQIDYDCSPWNRDVSMFETPDMDFVDYSALIPDSLEGISGDEAETTLQEQCSVCDALPGDSQTECKEALGC